MASTPVIVLPYAIPGVTQYIDQALLKPMFPTQWETEASAHWLFGADNPNMYDRMNGLAMARNCVFTVTAGGTGYTTPPVVNLFGGDGVGMTAFAIVAAGAVIAIYVDNPGTTPPTTPPTVSFGGPGTGATATAAIASAPSQNTGFLTTGAGRAGLITPFSESSAQTLCAVIKAPAAGESVMLLGNLTRTAGDGGVSAFCATSNVNQANMRGVTALTLANPAGMVAGTSYLFVMLSYSGSSVTAQLGGAAASTSSTGSRLFSTPPRRLALGNANYTDTTLQSPISAAELVVFPRQLTVAEGAGVYARAKQRLLPRGIAVL